MAEALQGKVAGVMVSKTSGKPGSGSDIVIRGVGSINGLNPLFVIDGVACDNNSNYNLNDIESIEVIKDASAAAIYGSRAPGGVVLITTKKGSFNAKPKLSFTSHVGVRQYTDMYDLLGTTDYIRVKQALGENYPIWSDPASLPNTDWVDEIYQSGIEQSYNLSLTGGSEKFRYYLLGAYERENGIQMNNYWERISARLNVDYKVNNSVTVGTRIYLARLRGNPYTESFPWVPIPYMNVYDEDGDYAAVPSGIDFDGSNPVAVIALQHQKQSDLLANADLFVDWEIVKGLKLNLTGSAQLGGGYDDNYSEPNNLGRSPSKDSYTKALNYDEQYTFTATLSYARKFDATISRRCSAGRPRTPISPI
ncbi:MAG: TonB-dependent receptor plug domain-containing protein [Alistipes senegalensis]